MTDTDNPVNRAAKAVGECDLENDSLEFIARAALVAALKVRWAPSRDCFSKNIDRSEDAVIGINLCAGTVARWLHPGVGDRPYRAWVITADSDDGQELGWFRTLAEAQSAVERAVVNAILGGGE